MKAFCLRAPGVVGYCDVARPNVGLRGAILAPVAVTPCTSDVHTVWGGGSPKQPDLVLGHECVARVVEVGAEVRDFAVGDVVAVPAITPDWRELDVQNGNERHAGRPFSGHKLGRSEPGVFAELFAISDADTTLARIPDGVSIEQALMSVDVVSTGLTGAEAAEVKIGDTVCVLGIGPIGLMAVAGAVMRGAGRVIAVGSRKLNSELAVRFGATDVLNYRDGEVVRRVMEMTGGRGVDSTIIAGGGDEAFTQAFDMTRYGGGTVANVNYFGGTGVLGFPKFSGGRGMAGKTLRTELNKGGRVRVERIMDMVRWGRLDPAPLVTHTLSGLDSVAEALEMTRAKEEGVLKVMVRI